MPKSFSDIWGRRSSPRLSLKDSLKIAIRGKLGLRKKVLEVIVALKKCTRFLNSKIASFRSMTARALNEAKRAYLEGDEERAKMFLNEAALVKRTERLMCFLKMCLEIMVNRLEMTVAVGDVLSNVKPVLKLMKVMGPLVSAALPELQDHMIFVQDVLEQICSEAEINITSTVPVELENKEAMDLYEALKLSVEKEAELGLPELPMRGTSRKVRTS